jgi:hypothetical protein
MIAGVYSKEAGRTQRNYSCHLIPQLQLHFHEQKKRKKKRKERKKRKSAKTRNHTVFLMRFKSQDIIPKCLLMSSDGD